MLLYVFYIRGDVGYMCNTNYVKLILYVCVLYFDVCMFGCVCFMCAYVCVCVLPVWALSYGKNLFKKACPG